jgi:hypothetical protein
MNIFFTAVLIDETRRNNSFPSLLFEGFGDVGRAGLETERGGRLNLIDLN